MTGPSNSVAPSLPGSRLSSLAAVDRVVVAVLALLLFGYVAGHRAVDADEGYYALAGRAILGGRWPYRDFFFPQMPLSAFAYGALRALGVTGLVGLRGFAAACAVGSTLLVQHGARRAAGRTAGIVAASLFAAHTLTWEWAGTVKTFPLGLLFGTGALVLAVAPGLTSRGALLAGVCSGLAVLSRGLTAPLLVAVFLGLGSHPGDATARRSLRRSALLGLGASLVPALLLCLLDPGAFWFDNVRYHALRSPGEGLVKDLAQKLDAARGVFLAPFGASRADATGFQSTALVVAIVGGSRRGDAAVQTFSLAALLVAGVAFLPSPVYVQYFAAALPPASMAAGIALSRCGLPRWAVAACLLGYAAVALPSFRERIRDVPALEAPAALHDVGRALDGVTREGDRVAAHWPSYLVGSEREPLDAAMNQFARLPPERVPSPADRRRYHLFTEEDFREALLRGEARAFVVGSLTIPETALSLKAAGWSFAAAPPGVTIWIAPPGGAAR